MSDFIKVVTTDHQIVYLNKNNIQGIEPVPASSRGSEHVRVYAGGYKWVIAESHESFFKKIGISIEPESGEST